MAFSSVLRLPEGQLAPLQAAYVQAVAKRRRATLLLFLSLALASVAAAHVAEVNPGKFWANIGNFLSYFQRLFTIESGALAGRTVLLDVGEWFWGLKKWLLLLADTLLIAYVGTLIGAFLAFLACFSTTENLVRRAWVRMGAKRLLETARTVPELVFALIFVIAFGLGPMAGVLALAIHTFGALGKQFAEVVDNIDMKPVDGAIASGGSWVQMIRFAVLPQVLSNFASYALLRFEINVRGASVMGFVGAGGIGQELVIAIRKFYYNDVSAILLLIIATVMIVDFLTARLRYRLIGQENGR